MLKSRVVTLSQMILSMMMLRIDLITRHPCTYSTQVIEEISSVIFLQQSDIQFLNKILPLVNLILDPLSMFFSEELRFNLPLNPATIIKWHSKTSSTSLLTLTQSSLNTILYVLTYIMISNFEFSNIKGRYLPLSRQNCKSCTFYLIITHL